MRTLLAAVALATAAARKEEAGRARRFAGVAGPQRSKPPPNNGQYDCTLGAGEAYTAAYFMYKESFIEKLAGFSNASSFCTKNILRRAPRACGRTGRPRDPVARLADGVPPALRAGARKPRLPGLRRARPAPALPPSELAEYEQSATRVKRGENTA